MDVRVCRLYDNQIFQNEKDFEWTRASVVHQ